MTDDQSITVDDLEALQGSILPSVVHAMPEQGSPVMAGVTALLILRGCADDRLEDVMAIIGNRPVPPTMNGMLDEIDDAIRRVMGT